MDRNYWLFSCDRFIQAFKQCDAGRFAGFDFYFLRATDETHSTGSGDDDLGWRAGGVGRRAVAGR